MPRKSVAKETVVNLLKPALIRILETNGIAGEEKLIFVSVMTQLAVKVDALNNNPETPVERIQRKYTKRKTADPFNRTKRKYTRRNKNHDAATHG